MSRCRGCNRILTVFEMRLKREDGSPEDLCATCRRHCGDGIVLGEIRDSDIFFSQGDFEEDLNFDWFGEEDDDE